MKLSSSHHVSIQITACRSVTQLHKDMLDILVIDIYMKSTSSCEVPCRLNIHVPGNWIPYAPYAAGLTKVQWICRLNITCMYKIAQPAKYLYYIAYPCIVRLTASIKSSQVFQFGPLPIFLASIHISRTITPTTCKTFSHIHRQWR